MEESLKNFAAQFSYQPVVEYKERWQKYSRFVVVGMGGSGLAAPLIRMRVTDVPIITHRDYGLPYISEKEKKDTLVIINSYSGNTEEALDAFFSAQKEGLALAAISTGGKLAELARSVRIPFVQMPDTNIQPRVAIGLNIKAILTLMGENALLAEVENLARTIHLKELKMVGQEIAGRLEGRIPVIYASQKNEAVAYAWKTLFNETVKIPAFYNSFPELNHNEMNGFGTAHDMQLTRDFYFLCLRDDADHPRILRRMDSLIALYKEQGVPIESVPFAGKGVFDSIFMSILLGHWTAYHLAKIYGVDPETVPLVEQFKKMI